MKKPGGLAVLLGVGDKHADAGEPDGDESEGTAADEDADGEGVAADLIDAVKASDAKGVWEALKAAHSLCSGKY